MQQCFLCHTILEGKNVSKLTNHVRQVHDLSFEDYVILSEYAGISPKCACGLCDERPLFRRGKFSKFALRHDEFEVREKLYVEKYGDPKCLHCGCPVSFYRGMPRHFCSPTCAGLHNGGFTQKETQDKIKEVVLEKYGVDNVSKLDSVKQKISEQNTGNSGWKHTPEALKKISEISKLAWEDNGERRASFREIMHEVRKRNWQDPAYRKTILQGNLKGKHSKLHQKVAAYLGLRELGFEDEKVLFRYRVDEIHFAKKIIVEINGDYIHANPSKFKSDDMIILRSSSYTAQSKWTYDQKRKEALEALGFRVFIVWQSDNLEEKKRELIDIMSVHD